MDALPPLAEHRAAWLPDQNLLLNVKNVQER